MQRVHIWLFAAPRLRASAPARVRARDQGAAHHRPLSWPRGAQYGAGAMPGSDAEIVAILREAVPDLIAVYRFGSTARGEARRDSDVDLAVLAGSPLAPVARFELQEDLAARLGRDVDLVDLGAAATVMRMQVIASGTLLAALDPPRQEAFEDHTYARLNEERREILSQIRREGRVYGR